MLLVVGVDGLGYYNLRGNLKPYFTFLSKLSEKYNTVKIKLDIGCSPINWTRIFSGQTLRKYTSYLTPVNPQKTKWRLIRRDELPVKFIWETHPDTVAINIPVVLPPISNIPDFKPVRYGIPLYINEFLEEIDKVKEAALKYLRKNKNVLCVFSTVDRLLHITANPIKYAKILFPLDGAIKTLITEALERNYHFIIVSDHGMQRISNELEGEFHLRTDIPGIRNIVKNIHQHDSFALYISNLDDYPQKLTDIYWIMRSHL